MGADIGMARPRTRIAGPGDTLLEPVRSAADPDRRLAWWAALLVAERVTTPAGRDAGVFVGARRLPGGGRAYGIYLGTLPRAAGDERKADG